MMMKINLNALRLLRRIKAQEARLEKLMQAVEAVEQKATDTADTIEDSCVGDYSLYSLDERISELETQNEDADAVAEAAAERVKRDLQSATLTIDSATIEIEY